MRNKGRRFMIGAWHRLRRGYGLARSGVIYHGNPVKRRRARAFYRAFVRPGDLCFDIGAHLGDRTGHFLALGARVVAVEPQPGPLAVLRQLYGANPRVTLIGNAVGAASGEAELAIDPTNPTVASLSPEWRAQVARDPSFARTEWRERHRVAVTTLDALIAAHGVPQFCKIDVEGFEAAVLQGLSQPLPTLSFEYIAAAREPALAALDRLAALGRYRFNRSPGESMRFPITAWRSQSEMTAELRALPADAGSGDIYAGLAP
jgi:FkbM family methyltransferase